MRGYEFVRVNAFSSGWGGGNPCAVVFDAEDLSQESRQRIAHDLNLSETAFVLWHEGLRAAARYFTPASEIPLAGHPTLSVAKALVETGRLEVGENPVTLKLELMEGPVDVEVLVRDGVTVASMAQRKPQFGKVYHAEKVLPAFGLEAGDALPDAPIQVVSTGVPQLMIPVCDLGTLQRARVNEELLAPLLEEGEFFSPHLFCLGGFTEAGTTAARHLGAPGVPEDPFTGSATGGMGAYLWHYGLIDEPHFRAEQGHGLGKPGAADVVVVGAREEPETVKVGGETAAIVRGRLLWEEGA